MSVSKLAARFPALFVGIALLALAPACDHPAPPPIVTTAPSGGAAASPSQSALSAPRRRPDPKSARGEAAGVAYLEIVTGGAELSAELPLVMAIHGLGDRPESFSTVLADLDIPVRLIVPRGLTSYSNGYSWFPLTKGLDDEETSRGIVDAAAKLAAALGELARTKPTRGKPIVTGFSQGGALSFAIAVLHPDAVAAAYPIGGWVAFPSPAKLSERPAAPPIVALHGDADTRVPIGPTREAVTKLHAAGLSVEMREFPGVAHTISEVMRRELKGLVTAAVAPR